MSSNQFPENYLWYIFSFLLVSFGTVLFAGCNSSDNRQKKKNFRSNPHGQHFLGNAHTLENFESAFYRSNIADNNSYEQWFEEGEKSAAQRANTIWKQMLTDYEPPPLDEAIDLAMIDYIERRKSEEPDAIG